MSRVTKTAEKRRQEIMSTARRLFLQRGYNNTSVANIANELGVAQGLIFHYFKSKSALLYAVFDEVSQEKQQQVEAFLQDLPSRVRAIDCLELFFDRSSQHQEFDVLISDLKDDPAIYSYIRDKIVLISIPLAQALIERGNADGSWRCEDPYLTAVFIVGGFSGIFKDPCDQDAEALMESSQQLLMRLLGADRNTTSERQQTRGERCFS